MRDLKFELPYFFLVDRNFQSGYPSFFNVEDYAWVKNIEDNWTVIRDEMLAELNPDEIAIPGYNPNLVSDAKVWRNICFYNYMWKKKAVCEKYPKTHALLKQIPNLSYAALNMLEPHSEIFPHQGDTNITARCHLGIVIPDGLPACGMRVNDEVTAWQEGRIFAFSDAHWHSVWNRTDKHRFVFVIDVVMNQYADKKEWYCANVLAVLTSKAIAYKINLLHKAPYFLKIILQKLIAAIWLLRLKFQ